MLLAVYTRWWVVSENKAAKAWAERRLKPSGAASKADKLLSAQGSHHHAGKIHLLCSDENSIGTCLETLDLL